MSGEVVRIEGRDQRMSLPEMKEQVRILDELLKHIMIKDTHYGTIPGTQKPTLYKPGSEKILSTFRIAATPGEVTDLSTDDEVRYRVRVDATAQVDQTFLGSGIGECSSDEEKYKWRKPVCDEEWDETPIDRRREVWKRGDKGPYKLKQVRQNPKDVANTILKMAKKRGQIDMTLTVTAASDVFDQDLEDLPPEVRDGIVGEGKEPVKPPQEKPAVAPEKPESELRSELASMCEVIGKVNGLTPSDILHSLTVNKEGKFGETDFAAIKFSMPKKTGGEWSPLKAVHSKAKEQFDKATKEGAAQG